MKKILLTTITLLTVAYVNAQQVKIENDPRLNDGADKKIIQKPAASPEVRAERSSIRMKADLGLTDDQYNKVLALKKEKFTAIKAESDKFPGPENRDARIAAVKPIRDAYVTGLKGILTTEQFNTYDAAVKRRFEAWKKSVSAQNNPQKTDEEDQLIKMQIE